MNDNTQNQYELVTPPDYKKQPLKGLNEWVSALRSGKYKQGVGRLYREDDDCYCCLGVKLMTEGFDKENLNEFACLFKSSKAHKTLSDTGFFPNDCYIISNGKKASSLVGCNDNLKLTFPQIADIIEQLWYHED